MKKLAAIVIFTLLGHFSLSAQVTSFSSLKTAVVATSPGNKLSGTPTNFAQLTWQVSGTISTCDVEIDSSTDGVTWSAGGLISNQVCTSAGSSTVVSTTVNYVRVNVSTLTGGGTITANFIGYATNSGGAISSITSTGSTIAVTGGTGPTTNLDLNLAHTNTWTALQTLIVSGGLDLYLGNGTAENDYISFGGRAFIGNGGSSGLYVQAGAGKIVSFNENGTFAGGTVGLFDGSGNFGVGTNPTTPSSDPFYVTSTGIVHAVSITAVTGGAEVVASSATPTFATTTSVSRIVLTSNITSFTLGAGSVDGQSKTLCFKQGSSPYTVAAPSNVHGFFVVGVTASDWNCQHFVYDTTDTIWQADSPGVINQ